MAHIYEGYTIYWDRYTREWIVEESESTYLSRRGFKTYEKAIACIDEEGDNNMKYELHQLAYRLKMSPFELAKNLNEQNLDKISMRKIYESPPLMIQHECYF